MKYLLLFLLPFSLYASKILSYNIYERSNRADVMITFDTPFNGVIKQSKSSTKVLIKLQGAFIESSRSKTVNSEFLHALVITPLKNQVQIVASISPDINLIASKTSDGYGLRLRFTNKLTATSKTTQNSSTSSLSNLPTKQNTEISTSYYIVVTILIIGIIILLVLKKKILLKTNITQKKSWLFNSNGIKIKEEAPLDVNSSIVSIRFQKAMDNTNRVVMLDFGDESYLVLMGNSNILLDRFKENKPSSQQEFDSILEDRNKELEDFLGTTQTKEPLQAYKERAASLAYGDEA